MTDNTTVQMSADDRSLSDADLDTVAGGLEQGGAWRQGAKGNWVYDGWAKQGSTETTYNRIFDPQGVCGWRQDQLVQP